MPKHEEVFKTETLRLTKHPTKQDFWLWDDTRGMNLAMWAESEREAFIQALEYYQKRLKEVESDHNSLVAKVDSFIGQIRPDDDEDSCVNQFR